MFFDFDNPRNRIIQQIYNISDQEISHILAGLPLETSNVYELDPQYLEVLTDRITQTFFSTIAPNIQQQWIQCYNTIKDISWPECQNYHDFVKLPNWIKHECIHVHGFDPELWLSQFIQPRIEQDLFTMQPIQARLDALIRYRHIILDNLDVIKDSDTVEFAADNGFFSFACLHHGAKQVLATEILSSQVEKIKRNAHEHENFLVEQHDIYKYQYNTKICHNKDLVLLCGILNHVNDHYNIIKSVCDARPKWIVIETESVDTDNDIPCVKWHNEFSYSRRSGFNQNGSQSLVGLPNTAWFNMVLGSFNYQLAKSSEFIMWHGPIVADSNKLNRVLYVYKHTR